MSTQTIKSVIREGHEAINLTRLAKKLQAHAGKILVRNSTTQNGPVLVRTIQQTRINWQFSLVDDDYHEDGHMHARVHGRAIYDKRNNSTPIPNYGAETKKEIIFCVHVINETPINEQWKQKSESDGEVTITNGVVEYALTIPCYKQVYIKAYDKKQDVEGYSKTFVAEKDQEITDVPVVFYADKKEEFKALNQLYKEIKNNLEITGKLTAQQAKEYAQRYEPLIERVKEADDKTMLAINKQLREMIQSLRSLDVKFRIWSEKQFENLKEYYNQRVRSLQNDNKLTQEQQSTFTKRFKEILSTSKTNLQEALRNLQALIKQLPTQEANTRRYQANAEYIAGYAAWPSGEAIRSQQENLYADFRFYWVQRGKTQPHLLRNTKKWTEHSGVYYLIERIPPDKPGRIIGRWISRDSMGYSEEVTLKKGEHVDYLPVTFPDPDQEAPKVPEELLKAMRYIKENRS